MIRVFALAATLLGFAFAGSGLGAAEATFIMVTHSPESDFLLG